MMTRTEIKALEESTGNAYSRDRYTDAAWGQIIRRLNTEGFTAEQIDWVLRSKHMRWAGDAANRNAYVTAADFANYVRVHLAGGYDRLRDDIRKDLGNESRRAVTGADLAGACEGEQIADLIDFALRVRREGRVADPADLVAHANRILAEIERRAK